MSERLKSIWEESDVQVRGSEFIHKPSEYIKTCDSILEKGVVTGYKERLHVINTTSPVHSPDGSKHEVYQAICGRELQSWLMPEGAEFIETVKKAKGLGIELCNECFKYQLREILLI